jgi:hypothetical protein
MRGIIAESAKLLGDSASPRPPKGGKRVPEKRKVFARTASTGVLKTANGRAKEAY